MTNPYRAMAKKFDAPYETGITKLAVLRRDVWTCRMEVCCYGDARIDPEVKWKGHGEVIPDEIGTIDITSCRCRSGNTRPCVVERSGCAPSLQSGEVQSLQSNIPDEAVGPI